MADITTSPEDERTVSEMYDNYQRLNQEAHDRARDQIMEAYEVTAEVAEGMPEIEERFNMIREEMSMAQNGQVQSVIPDTGEPGPPAARIAPARPPVRSTGAAPRLPQVPPPAYAPAAPQPVPASGRREYAEQMLAQMGYDVLQSHCDYTEGLITLVIR